MWQDEKEFEQMQKHSKTQRVKEQIKLIYNQINEQRRIFDRQRDAHNEMMFGLGHPDNA